MAAIFPRRAGRGRRGTAWHSGGTTVRAVASGPQATRRQGRRTGPRSGRNSGTAGGRDGRSHDPDFPEAFLAVHAHGLAGHRADGRPRPEAPNHAKRRAALSAAFPGETLVIPSGSEKVRANDTDYPFRPGSDFVYLTGEHDPDACWCCARAAGHDATLYMRPRSPRDTDEFFRNARTASCGSAAGTRWREKSTELGVPTPPTWPRWARRWPAARRRAPGCCAASTPRVDAAVRPYDGPRRGPAARDRELATALVRAAAGQGRVGDRPAAGRDRRHRARLRGRGPGAAGRPAGRRAAARGRLRRCAPGTTATTSATARSSAPARTPRSCTGCATPAPPARASCC